MSLLVPAYPEPRYSGDSGEVSATMRKSDSPADCESFGLSFHYLATKASTEGDFGLYRVDLAPAAGGPGPHFHKTMSESFFVLSGTMSLFDGRNWVDSTAGDFLHVPAAGSTASATRPTSPPPCSWCSPRERPAKRTSRASPAWPTRPTRSAASSLFDTTTTTYRDPTTEGTAGHDRFGRNPIGSCHDRG